jgi:hypothetical protein
VVIQLHPHARLVPTNVNGNKRVNAQRGGRFPVDEYDAIYAKIDRLDKRGLTANEIALLIGCSSRTIERRRAWRREQETK